MATVFTPEHSSLDRIFAANSTYHIPAYQRPYAWEATGRSDRDNQVIQMWEDLWSFYEQNRDSNREYFLGSMVIIEDAEKLRTFQVIDGQQRLTTLLLLFAAMHCFLQEILQHHAEPARSKWIGKAIQTLESFIYNEEGPSLVPTLKLKIERTVGANFNQVLEQAVACQSDGALAGIEGKHQQVAARYFKNRDYFLGRIRESFLSAAQPGELDIPRFDDFFRFLRTRVALVLIKTTDFSTAYRIFEILNNRGLPLSNLDLLRNFVLEQLAAAGIPDPDQRWERLEEEYLFTEDFVGRWVVSLEAEQPRATAFSDIQRIFRDDYQAALTRKKIEVFYDDLEENLRCYTLLSAEQDIRSIAIRNAVVFVQSLGNERYTRDLLLALFRQARYTGGAHPEILAFLRAYRSYAMYVFLQGRFSSRRIFDSIRCLNRGDLVQAAREFDLSPGERAVLANWFDGSIRDNEIGRILLAAYVRSLDEGAPDVVTQQLHYETCTLEHIIPQSPAAGSNWLRDFDAAFRSEYTYRIGNMTLLTQSKNAANKNYDFAKKRAIYAQSKLAMTVRLGEVDPITPDFIRARQREIVAALVGIFIS